MRIRIMSVLVALLALSSCNDAGGPGGGATVSVRFQVDPSMPAAATASAMSANRAASDLPTTGTNGTLTLTGMWLVVGEFELERAEGACAQAEQTQDEEGEDDAAEDECEEFEAPPAFVTVPLDGDQVGIVTQDGVPPGTYREIEFETKPPRADGALLAEIRQVFPDWPASASLLVTGTFTPAGGDPVPFRVYFDAEVEVELDLGDQPLVVAEGGNQTVTVSLNPAVWFVNDNGTVKDLSALDFGATGKVAKLEVEFEDAVTEIELEHD